MINGLRGNVFYGQNIQSRHHSIVWNINNYNSGLYFVHMIAGEHVNTQKINADKIKYNLY